jgi:hypothetical protein
MADPTIEQQGEWFFRTRLLGDGQWMGEAKRTPFAAQNAVEEPAGDDLWFDFANSRERVLAKLKREVWS